MRTGASGPGFREGNGFDYLGFGFCRQVAAPEEPESGQLFLDQQHPEAFIASKCHVDFGASTEKKVAPSVATRGIATCRLGHSRRRMEEFWMGFDQIGPPIRQYSSHRQSLTH